MSSKLEIIRLLKIYFSLSLRHLVPPESVSVEARKTVHHDGDGESENEKSCQGTKSSN